MSCGHCPEGADCCTSCCDCRAYGYEDGAVKIARLVAPMLRETAWRLSREEWRAIETKLREAVDAWLPDGEKVGPMDAGLPPQVP